MYAVKNIKKKIAKYKLIFFGKKVEQKLGNFFEMICPYKNFDSIINSHKKIVLSEMFFYYFVIIFFLFWQLLKEVKEVFDYISKRLEENKYLTGES